MTQTDPPFPWPEGKRAAVSLTFDDARGSQLEQGMPLLREYGVRATFYAMLPGLEGCADMWRAALAEGHEIGCHTLSHPCSGNFVWSRANALEDYTLERMECEMREASRRIEAAVGAAPRTFAYPCGQKFVGRGRDTQSYVPLVARHFLAGRGFRDETCNDPRYCDPAQLMAVDADGMTPEEARGWVDRAAREGTWLVLAAHDIGAPAFQTMTCETLAALCAYCREPQRGIWIDTVQAVAEHLAHENRRVGRI